MEVAKDSLAGIDLGRLAGQAFTDGVELMLMTVFDGDLFLI